MDEESFGHCRAEAGQRLRHEKIITGWSVGKGDSYLRERAQKHLVRRSPWTPLESTSLGVLQHLPKCCEWASCRFTGPVANLSEAWELKSYWPGTQRRCPSARPGFQSWGCAATCWKNNKNGDNHLLEGTDCFSKMAATSSPNPPNQKPGTREAGDDVDMV